MTVAVVLIAAACAAVPPGAAPGGGPEAAVSAEAVRSALQAHGIPVDPSAAETAAARAIAAAADPQARFVTADEAIGLTTGRTVAAAETWAGEIHYLKFDGLRPGGEEALAAWTHAHGSNACGGLIVDLRGAGGTDLDTADRAAGLVLPTNAPLYSVRDGTGGVVELRYPRPGGFALSNAPLVLLTSDATHGAAEVLAAALRGRPGVLVIGEPTRGDMALRSAVPVATNLYLWIAARRAAAPDGAALAGGPPDVSVAATPGDDPSHNPALAAPRDRPLSEKAQRDRDLMRRVGGDAALARAVDVMLGLKAVRSRPWPKPEPLRPPPGPAAPAGALP